MKISELIAALSDIQADTGDIDVKTVPLPRSSGSAWGLRHDPQIQVLTDEAYDKDPWPIYVTQVVLR